MSPQFSSERPRESEERFEAVSTSVPSSEVPARKLKSKASLSESLTLLHSTVVSVASMSSSAVRAGTPGSLLATVNVIQSE